MGRGRIKTRLALRELTRIIGDIRIDSLVQEFLHLFIVALDGSHMQGALPPPILVAIARRTRCRRDSSLRAASANWTTATATRSATCAAGESGTRSG